MSGSPLFSWVVVIVMGVRITCLVDKSGPGRTKVLY